MLEIYAFMAGRAVVVYTRYYWGLLRRHNVCLLGRWNEKLFRCVRYLEASEPYDSQNSQWQRRMKWKMRRAWLKRKAQSAWAWIKSKWPKRKSDANESAGPSE